MALEIQVLNWDMSKTVAELNRLMGSQRPIFLDLRQDILYKKKQKTEKPVQIHFHS